MLVLWRGYVSCGYTRDLRTASLLLLMSMNQGLLHCICRTIRHNSSVWQWCPSMGCAVVKRVRIRQGKHSSRYVPMKFANYKSQLASVVEILYCPIILSAKLAILLQIKHVFVTSRKSVRFYLIQIFIWSNAFWYITNIFLQALQCSPRAKIWKPLLPGHCFTSFFTLSFINTILNVVSDIAMLVMPILWVWKLQMTRKRKLGISLIFASGIL